MYMFIYVERFSWKICFLWICDLFVLDKVSVLAWKNSEKCLPWKNVKSTFAFEKKQFSDWILSMKTVCDNIYDWERTIKMGNVGFLSANASSINSPVDYW